MSALCLMSADMNTKACHTNKGSDTQTEVQEVDDASFQRVADSALPPSMTSGRDDRDEH